MRFASFAIAVASLTRDVMGVTDCSDLTNATPWYVDLVAAGLLASNTPTSLHTAIATADSSDTTLLAHLVTPDACGTILTAFANAVNAALYANAQVGIDCDAGHQTSAACLVWLYDAINTVNADPTMDGKDIVTGNPNVRCTNAEWTNLTYAYRSMVPMYYAARFAGTFAAAIAAMPDNADLANLQAAIVGIGCVSVFGDFVLKANSFYTNQQAAVDAACADPYTTGCVSAFSSQLAEFTTSSGQVLNWSATSTTCTTAQFEALVNADVADNVLAAAAASPSVVSLTAALNAVYTTIGTDNLNAPCWLCFAQLGRAVYNLDSADLATCSGDITGAACYAIIGGYIDGFHDCSGSSFVLAATTAAPTTTAATTAVTTAAATTAATTAAATTATAAPTTPKTSALALASTGLVALLLVVAL